MAIGTAHDHSTDFTRILGERSNASYYYTTEQIIDEELDNIETSKKAIDSELPNAEAKCLAFARLSAAVEHPVWLDVQRHNQLVDEVLGFHSTRLATAGILSAYNLTVPITSRDGQQTTNTVPLSFTEAAGAAGFHPNVGNIPRAYLNTPGNGTANILAWQSNIGIGSTFIGVSTTPRKADNNVNYHEQSRYEYIVKRACGISLEPDTHWVGRYKPGNPGTGGNNLLYIDEDGNPQFGDRPVLECPIDEQLNGAGETEIYKVNIRIRGYDLEGENPVEIVECDLSAETAGVGTISIYQTIKHRFDVGINTDTSGSWTWDGVSYTGDVIVGSANYNTYVAPRLTEIAELKTKIQDALPNVNKVKDSRTESDLYYWSLEHSKVVDEDRKSTKEGNLQAIRDSQEIFDESAGVPPPQEPEINPLFNKPFSELKTNEKKQLSLTYGLGTPREVPARDEDGDVIRDENGKIVMTTDDGYNIDYIDSKVQEFLELNKNLDVTGDYIVTRPGSIIIVNSVGTATTYTGVSTQINNIRTGGINTSNIAGGSVSISTFVPASAAFTTSHILKSPSAEVGAGVTYSGTIGDAASRWDEIYTRTIFVDNIVGSATSVVVSSAKTETEFPLVFCSAASTTRYPTDLFVSGGTGIGSTGGILTWQESLGKLNSTSVSAGNTHEIKLGKIEDGTITTDAGVIFTTNGDRLGGVFTEVQGRILSYGINVEQLETTFDTTRVGGIFRLDTRTSGTFGDANCFVVKGRSIGVTAEHDAFVIDLDTGHTILTPDKGYVGIGTSLPNAALHVESETTPSGWQIRTNSVGLNNESGFWRNTSDHYQMVLRNASGGLSYITNDGGASTANLKFFVQGSNRLIIDSSGNVSIGGNVSITGSISKGSGMFKIDHPLVGMSTTHNLVHSFIESPQADIIYRGKVDLVGGSATVNIDTAGRMTEGTFDALCTNVQCFTSNETDWTAVKGSVSGNILTITAQDSSSTATVSWMVVGERKDQHMIDTEWTDENGRVITEPLKAVSDY
mgnify:CR=1 FL=1